MKGVRALEGEPDGRRCVKPLDPEVSFMGDGKVGPVG